MNTTRWWSVAGRLQQAFNAQTFRDLHRIAECASTHECTVVVCERARFWRGRLDDALDEIDDLRAQMRASGIHPQPRRDGHQSGLSVHAG